MSIASVESILPFEEKAGEYTGHLVDEIMLGEPSCVSSRSHRSDFHNVGVVFYFLKYKLGKLCEFLGHESTQKYRKTRTRKAFLTHIIFLHISYFSESESCCLELIQHKGTKSISVSEKQWIVWFW